MLKSGKRSYQLSQLGNLVLFTIVASLMVVHVTFWDFNNIHSFTGGKIVDRKNGGPAKYVTLYLVASLVFAAHILSACHARRNNGRAKVIQTLSTETLQITLIQLLLAPLFAAVFIAFSLIDMIVVMGWKVHVRTWTKPTSVTFGILNLFFQACVLGNVALLASSLGDEEMSQTRDEKVGHRESDASHPVAANGA
jgi:hypothetical protein